MQKNYRIFSFGSFLPEDVYVNLMDLVKSCPTTVATSILLQKMASIEPESGLLKFAKRQLGSQID